MNKYIVIALLVFGLAAPVNAATRYADSTSGACTGNYSIANRNCTGSDGNSYATVQLAVNASSAGDTVYVRAGTYSENVATAANGGNEAGRITLSAYNSESVTITRYTANHNYNSLVGFTLVGGSTDYSNTITIGVNADYTEIKNNVIGIIAFTGYGVYFNSTGAYSTYDGATHCLIDNNEIGNITALNTTCIMLNGSYNTISNNNFHDIDETQQGIYLFGHHHTISENTFADFTDNLSHPYHIDILQTLGNGPTHDNVFEKNFAYNISGAIAQLSGEGGITESVNNIFRNNVFVNVDGKASISIQTHWYNNIFYNTSGKNAAVNDYQVLYFVRHSQAISNISSANPAQITVAYNAAIPTGSSFTFAGVAGAMGTLLNGNTYAVTKIDAENYTINADTTGLGYEASATDYVYHASADGSNVENNIFLNCGVDPSSTTQGWYSIEAGSSLGTIDYNYVAGTSYAAKTGFTETHGVNGGNPYLANIGGTTAADYALTANSTILIDAGNDLSELFTDDYDGNTRSGTWDIGAYEYDSGGADATAPVPTISESDSTITSNSLTVTGTSTDAVGVSGCKFRIGSAPDAGNGTACTGTTSFSCAVTDFTSGSNTLYVGCYDAAGNYGSDSIIVTFTPPTISGGISISGGSIQ